MSNRVNRRGFASEQELIQLELSSVTIRQMVIDSELLGEELHCLNRTSKKVIKQILLDKLARCID